MSPATPRARSRKTRFAACRSIRRRPSTRPSTRATTFFFCSAGCREKFVAEPARYPGGHGGSRRRRNPRPRARSTPARCIRRSARTIPGHCPICGMALEPEVATAATGPSAELVDMTRRFWIALALSVPVFALEMGGHLADLHAVVPEAFPTGFSWRSRRRSRSGRAGRSSSAAGRRSRPRNLNMFTLIAMGVGVAWAYSVVATVAPDLFPPAFRGGAWRRRGLFRSRGGDHRPLFCWDKCWS